MSDEVARNNNIVLKWKINYIASWMSLKNSYTIVPEELVQYWNFLYFRLPSGKHTYTCCQANKESVGTDSKKFLWFSRNEPLHLFLDALVVSDSDEEETLLFSILHHRRKYITFVQCQVDSCFQWELLSVNCRQVLFFVVLPVLLIGMQNLSHPVWTHTSRAHRLEFLYHCCSISSRI